ncbi:MAG: ribonuclease P protein component [Acidimicrobiia bacterium]
MRRVRGRETFRALAGARRHRAGPVAIRVLPSGDTTAPAVAYAIGRGVGNAVVRNRLRRRLREIVRTHGDLLEPGSAYLVGAGAGAVALTSTELDRIVVDALRRSMAGS